MPGAEYWTNNEGFHAIFGLLARITVASFIAFLCGSFLNAFIMSRRKSRGEKSRLHRRYLFGAVAGEAVDSAVFFPIAFIGVLAAKEVFDQALFQFILKTAYEIIFLPLVLLLIKTIKKAEATDVTDTDISYHVFKI